MIITKTLLRWNNVIISQIEHGRHFNYDCERSISAGIAEAWYCTKLKLHWQNYETELNRSTGWFFNIKQIHLWLPASGLTCNTPFIFNTNWLTAKHNLLSYTNWCNFIDTDWQLSQKCNNLFYNIQILLPNIWGGATYKLKK